MPLEEEADLGRPPHRPYSLTASRAMAALDATPRGLDDAEAARRRAIVGPNKLPEVPRPTLLALIGRQFRDAMVGLLVGALALSLVLGEYVDAVVIGALVVANAALGAIQEGRAEAAAQAVRGLLAPRALVIRQGATRELDAAELVSGDVVLATAGDRVPADCRVLDADRLEIDESTLTGESTPAAKRAEPPAAPEASLPERPTMAYSGTTLTRGRARLLVVATGSQTELARIARAAEAPETVTPLESRLDQFARTLLRVAIVIALTLAVVSWAHGESVGESLLVGVALAVAAVPEGLPAVVTITLALGMRRLARRGAIVRRLRAVETLGSASVICTDKTGTLTTNRMVVARVLPLGADPDAEEARRRLLAAALVASGELHDPGEAAIAAAAKRSDLRREEVLGNLTVVGGEPFDSARKRMSVVVAPRDGGARTSYVKGAPEVLLPRLAADEDADRLAAEAAAWAQDAIRVMLVAVRHDIERGEDPERELEPVGLIGLADPVRERVPASVAVARQAGIRTIMITGDHRETAVAVARACGIAAPAAAPRAITGPELDRLEPAELERRIGAVDVFARVAPEHKSRIVDALHARMEVVAMTGDGVNDTPALVAADVGVAMGRTGSDAAAEAADIVLTDDDYSTLVAAVEGGRRIYDNILHFIGFLLAANAGEVLLFTLAVAPGIGAPLTVVQILLVNLLTDGPPAVALGVDPLAPESMRRPPRPRAQRLLDPMRTQLVVGGISTGLAAFSAFMLGQGQSLEAGQTMAFTTLVFGQLAYVFAVRGERPAWRGSRNPALYAAVAATAAFAGAVLGVPALAELFGIARLSAGQLIAALSLAALPLLSTEVRKAMRRRKAGQS
jgi:P-type Ca2+ transporter type 2C